MKKVLRLLFAMVFVFSFVFCLPATTAQAAAKPKITEINMPEKIALKASAVISFKVDQKCSASVEIYNSKNKLVSKLAAKSVNKNATVTFKWNGKNSKKKFVEAGKYKIKIKAGKTAVTKYINVSSKVSITNVSITDKFASGQQDVNVVYTVDCDCSTYIEILDTDLENVATFEAYKAKKGETVTFTWDGTDMDDVYVIADKYFVIIYTNNSYFVGGTEAYHPSEGYLGGYYVKILNYDLVTDYTGKPAIRVYFEFNNKSDSTKSYQCDKELRVECYQNDEQIYTTGINYSDQVDADKNGQKWINPGESTVCTKIFPLHGNTPLKIDVFGNETYDTSNPMIQKVFSLQ